MTRLTGILDRMQNGDQQTAGELLSLVYGELRQLAAAKLAREAPGQTLQPTALVHEAWLRLGGEQSLWDNHGHFFAAAAEAMRRILIDRARQRQVRKKAGLGAREELHESRLSISAPSEQLIEIHDVLDHLAEVDAAAANLVKLRYFMGMTMPEAAKALDLPLRSAERLWAFARAWLRQALREHKTA